VLNDSKLEALIDRRVQARLSTDRDYLFAEDAEQQALAERKIELQEEQAVLGSATLDPSSFDPSYPAYRLGEIEQELQLVNDELHAS
jgi:hypothetical protein